LEKGRMRGLPPSLSAGGIPLFGKWFDETHHLELVEGEGLGEILIGLYLFYFRFLAVSGRGLITLRKYV